MTRENDDLQVPGAAGGQRRRMPGWRLWWRSNFNASEGRGHQRLAAEGGQTGEKERDLAHRCVEKP